MTAAEQKPLFIPLKTKWFEQFRSGEKRSELRLYGPRWNERTCPVGRRVVLSKGYGKAERLSGIVREFRKVWGYRLSIPQGAAILETFGTADVEIAEIRIDLEIPCKNEMTAAEQGGVKTCLDCKWLSEPKETHKLHRCLWPKSAMPKAGLTEPVHFESINREHPFQECAAWEEPCR